MRIWVTRTAPGNEATALRLRALGHEPICVPVLEVRRMRCAAMPAGVDAIVFTSRNGVGSLPALAEHLDVPVFTVGDGTAEAAREAGYRAVRSAEGDVSDLQALVAASLSAPASIVHFCARHTAGDLKGFLEKLGHQVTRRIVYSSVPASSPEGVGSVLLPMVGGIVVHSPRGAENVARALESTRWSGAIWCISEACAVHFAAIPDLEIHVAARPSEKALIELVREHRVRRLAVRTSLRIVGASRREANDNGWAPPPDPEPPAA